MIGSLRENDIADNEILIWFFIIVKIHLNMCFRAYKRRKAYISKGLKCTLPCHGCPSYRLQNIAQEGIPFNASLNVKLKVNIFNVISRCFMYTYHASVCKWINDNLFCRNLFNFPCNFIIIIIIIIIAIIIEVNSMINIFIFFNI